MGVPFLESKVLQNGIMYVSRGVEPTECEQHVMVLHGRRTWETSVMIMCGTVTADSPVNTICQRKRVWFIRL